MDDEMPAFSAPSELSALSASSQPSQPWLPAWPSSWTPPRLERRADPIHIDSLLAGISHMGVIHLDGSPTSSSDILEDSDYEIENFTGWAEATIKQLNEKIGLVMQLEGQLPTDGDGDKISKMMSEDLQDFASRMVTLVSKLEADRGHTSLTEMRATIIITKGKISKLQNGFDTKKKYFQDFFDRCYPKEDADDSCDEVELQEPKPKRRRRLRKRGTQ